MITAILASILTMNTLAQQTEQMYLSGKGSDDAIKWDFWCSDGMNSKKWSKIAVPSCWEQQGFGGYTYGRYYIYDWKDNAPYKDYREHTFTDEYGIYRYTFTVPANWNKSQIDIVFDGVMTDAEVKINGISAGPIHRGAFYQFRYDITNKVKCGKKNKLEVVVRKQSTDKSVNAAERRADWWLFGGIYRPVWLESKPTTHIEHVAVDAKADGALTTMLEMNNLPEGAQMELSLIKDGNTIGEKRCKLSKESKQVLTTHWKDIKTWDPEHPHLYYLALRLLANNGTVLHKVTERIGFRTVEFRPKDGIYLNGVKLLVKGTNRHCFDPVTGRTVSHKRNVQDIHLIKQMNMNAVRSHYSPDTDFLNLCDSLGLLYLDEFCGWQNSYSDETAASLLPEMISRDVNHPCIFIWSNGNEGGWNTSIDKHFAYYDPQHRHVVHPWADFDQLDTRHYPTAQDQAYRLERGQKVFMMTEFLHGLYDRGQGAGLEGLWNKFKRSPLFAGGFIWAYVDEALYRTDTRKMDTYGPNAPDGIVSAERQKMASFYTVREVWSPIQIKPFEANSSFTGDFLVENGYLFTRFDEIQMGWKTLTLPLNGKACVVDEGKVDLPNIRPGETGWAHFCLPSDFRKGDLLVLEAYTLKGDTVCTWTYPIKRNKQYYAEHAEKRQNPKAASYEDHDDIAILTANDIQTTFSKKDGSLKEIRKGGTIIPLTNGPTPVGMKMKLKSCSLSMQGDTAVYTAKYDGAVDSIVWRMTPDGLLGMDATVLNFRKGNQYKGDFVDNPVLFLGFSFSFPEEQVNGMRWMGKGPYRVWKNRIKGTNYGIWHKDYNNTVTGEYYYPQIYPEFKGYHAGLYWASLESPTTPVTIYSESDGIFLRVFTPEEQRDREGRGNSIKEWPAGDISLLLEIPAIHSQGADGDPSIVKIRKGDEGYQIKFWFKF